MKNSMFQNLIALLKQAVEAIKWPLSDISMSSTDVSLCWPIIPKWQFGNKFVALDNKLLIYVNLKN